MVRQNDFYKYSVILNILGGGLVYKLFISSNNVKIKCLNLRYRKFKMIEKTDRIN